MAMIVKNNMPAKKTLNQLNKNSKALEKSLSKVSSGMKINSAQDDAAGFSISEKMRVQVRALDQANQNVQNGMSMVKTAEGAVETTLNLMRTLKEKAINAANDSNTDADRATIQKEIDQYIDQIDDNALTSFNGKILLDGSYQPIHFQELDDMQKIVRGLNSAWISDAMELIKNGYGIDFNSPDSKAKYLDIEFVGGDTGVPVDSDMTSALAWCSADWEWTGSFQENGNPEFYLRDNKITLTFNLDKIKNLDVRDTNGEVTSLDKMYLDRIITHELTHGIMFSVLGYDYMNGSTDTAYSDTSLPMYIIEGGTAELIHGADDTRLNSMMNSFASTDTLVEVLTDSGTLVSQTDRRYGGGYAVMHYFCNNAGVNPSETMKTFMDILQRDGATISDAFEVASKGKWKDQFDSDGTLVKSARTIFEETITGDLDRWLKDGGTVGGFLTERCGLDFSNDDTGSIVGKDSGGKLKTTAKNVVHEVGETINWAMPTAGTSMIAGLEVRWPPFMSAGATGGSMVFHTGAKANDSIHIGFMDMRAKALGLYDEEGQKLSVATQAKARAAISTIDKIIETVVGEQTNLGAIQARLEYTSSNVTVSSENTQASESVIRDADMAKEMTAYTKNNVLLQAAQSMLAQANQNSSQVLSLLQ